MGKPVTLDEEHQESLMAVLQSPGWCVYLERIIRPKVLVLRRSILTNSSADSATYLQNLLKLRETMDHLETAYTSAGYTFPDSIKSWFE